MKTMFETITKKMFEAITRRTASTCSPFLRKGRSVFLMPLAFLVALNLCPANVHGQSHAAAITQQNPSTPEATPDDRINQEQADGLKIFALRLRPGQDLRTELERFSKERNIKAGFIMTAVGSLKKPRCVSPIKAIRAVSTASLKSSRSSARCRRTACIYISRSPIRPAKPSAAISSRAARFIRRQKSSLVKPQE